MRTEKQIEASRRNGAKSRGPVTPMGKRRSSRNSLRHARITCTLALSLEDESEFREIFRELCDNHQPADYTEHSLIESMAMARWHMFRTVSAAATEIDRKLDEVRQNPPKYKHEGAAAISKSMAELLEGHRFLTSMNVERSRLERDYMRALGMLYKAQDRRLRRKGPNAQATLKPVPQPQPEIPEPEILEPTDPIAESVGRL